MSEKLQTCVAGVVLAAGTSSRFGSPKQILPWGNSTLVAHAAAVALSAGLDPVVVVTGFAADLVCQALAVLPVRTVFNPCFEEGQGTSVRTAIAALPPGCRAAVFLLCDQPGVTAELIRSIVEAHDQTNAPIVAPFFQGRRGNPVLFAETLFSEMRALAGEAGGRQLLDRHERSIVRLDVQDASILRDIDTPEDYRSALTATALRAVNVTTFLKDQKVCSSLPPCHRACQPAAQCKRYSLTCPKQKIPEQVPGHAPSIGLR